MDEKGLRDLLRGRLYIELQLFKDRLLQQDKDVIYQSAYEIEIRADIYEVLQEDMEEMGEEELRALLYRRNGILKGLYQEWLTWEDGFFQEFRKYIREKAGMGHRADDGTDREETGRDGEECDKAA